MSFPYSFHFPQRGRMFTFEGVKREEKKNVPNFKSFPSMITM